MVKEKKGTMFVGVCFFVYFFIVFGRIGFEGISGIGFLVVVTEVGVVSY